MSDEGRGSFRGPLAEIVATWRPEPVRSSRRLDLAPIIGFSALLDRSMRHAEADPVPLGWHWFHFTPSASQSSLGGDGHPARGPFLPPFPGRRRMMAGGRFEQYQPLRVGDRCDRVSHLEDVRLKNGRTGEMLFTTVRHELRVEDRTALREWEHVVYRQQPPARPRSDRPSANPAPAGPTVDSPTGATVRTSDVGSNAVRLRCDTTALFRFSALTFNAHRIHYDHPYATAVEGYPDLVVHGPLLGLLMLEPARRAGLTPTRFEYRLRSPVFAGQTVEVERVSIPDGQLLTIRGATGAPAATATVGFEPASTADRPR